MRQALEYLAARGWEWSTSLSHAPRDDSEALAMTMFFHRQRGIGPCGMF